MTEARSIPPAHSRAAALEVEQVAPATPPAGGSSSAAPQGEPEPWKAVHRALRDAAIRATEAATPLSLVILQIENPERIDQAHAGRLERQLRQAALTLEASTDAAGLPWLYGTNRLVFILPGTKFASALGKIEQLRHCIRPGGTAASASDLEVSVGVAEYTPKESLGHFIQRAIDALVRDESRR